MKVATANRLTDGTVVFLGGRQWEATIERAFVAQTDTETRGLEAMMLQSEATQEVVGAYLIDVTQHADRVEPDKLRERIRASGPTVRADLVKPASNANDL